MFGQNWTDRWFKNGTIAFYNKDMIFKVLFSHSAAKNLKLGLHKSAVSSLSSVLSPCTQRRRIQSPKQPNCSVWNWKPQDTVHSTVASVQGQSRTLGLYPQRNWVLDLLVICPKRRFDPGQPAEEENLPAALIWLGVMKVPLLNYSGVQTTNK